MYDLLKFEDDVVARLKNIFPQNFAKGTAAICLQHLKARTLTLQSDFMRPWLRPPLYDNYIKDMASLTSIFHLQFNLVQSVRLMTLSSHTRLDYLQLYVLALFQRYNQDNLERLLDEDIEMHLVVVNAISFFFELFIVDFVPSEEKELFVFLINACQKISWILKLDPLMLLVCLRLLYTPFENLLIYEKLLCYSVMISSPYVRKNDSYFAEAEKTTIEVIIKQINAPDLNQNIKDFLKLFAFLPPVPLPINPDYQKEEKYSEQDHIDGLYTTEEYVKQLMSPFLGTIRLWAEVLQKKESAKFLGLELGLFRGIGEVDSFCALPETTVTNGFVIDLIKPYRCGAKILNEDDLEVTVLNDGQLNRVNVFLLPVNFSGLLLYNIANGLSLVPAKARSPYGLLLRIYAFLVREKCNVIHHFKPFALLLLDPPYMIENMLVQKRTYAEVKKLKEQNKFTKLQPYKLQVLCLRFFPSFDSNKVGNLGQMLLSTIFEDKELPHNQSFNRIECVSNQIKKSDVLKGKVGFLARFSYHQFSFTRNHDYVIAETEGRPKIYLEQKDRKHWKLYLPSLSSPSRKKIRLSSPPLPFPEAPLMPSCKYIGSICGFCGEVVSRVIMYSHIWNHFVCNPLWIVKQIYDEENMCVAFKFMSTSSVFPEDIYAVPFLQYRVNDAILPDILPPRFEVIMPLLCNSSRLSFLSPVTSYGLGDCSKDIQINNIFSLGGLWHNQKDTWPSFLKSTKPSLAVGSIIIHKGYCSIAHGIFEDIKQLRLLDNKIEISIQPFVVTFRDYETLVFPSQEIGLNIRPLTASTCKVSHTPFAAFWGRLPFGRIAISNRWKKDHYNMLSIRKFVKVKDHLAQYKKAIQLAEYVKWRIIRGDLEKGFFGLEFDPYFCNPIFENYHDMDSLKLIVERLFVPFASWFDQHTFSQLWGGAAIMLKKTFTPEEIEEWKGRHTVFSLPEFDDDDFLDIEDF